MPVAVDQTGVLSGKTVIAIAVGANHSLALCSDGTVAAWGSNFAGQLGNNSSTSSLVPVLVDTTGLLSGKVATAVCAGEDHSLALCSDGTLAAWGNNTAGQFGNSSNTSSFVPAAVTQTGLLSGKTVTAIAAVRASSMAVCSDGTLAVWGLNFAGQLGTNNTTTSYVPVAAITTSLPPGDRFVGVGASSHNQTTHSLGITASTPPVIGVEQPVGSSISNGGTRNIVAAVGAPGTMTFTITNRGGSDATGLSVAKNGTDAGDFTVTSVPASTLIPGASTTYTLQFAPTTTGTKTAAIHIASNAATNNPFDINLTGQVLLTTADGDGDGMSDAAEFTLAAVGFDWQVAQPAKVSAFLSNSALYNQTQYNANRTAGRNDVINAPNTYNLYTLSQVQGLNAGATLLTVDAVTGKFKLTLGMEKSANLQTWQPFSFTAPETTINAQGKIEFLFTAPGNAAFFRLQTP